MLRRDYLDVHACGLSESGTSEEEHQTWDEENGCYETSMVQLQGASLSPPSLLAIRGFAHLATQQEQRHQQRYRAGRDQTHHCTPQPKSPSERNTD